MSKFVQLKDDQVLMAFPCQQDSEQWFGLIEVDDDDSRYLAFIAPPEPEVVLTDPLEKLKVFLLANPDVAAILA